MSAATMSSPAAASSDISRGHGRVASAALRYGVSSFGPVAISGAHFLASLMFLRAFSRTEFGLFSLLLTIVPFCLSISGALVGASFARAAVHANDLGDGMLATHLKVSRLFSLVAGLIVFALFHISDSGSPVDMLLGAYAGLMTLRWFARNVGYVQCAPLRVAMSDAVYAGALVTGLLTLHAAHHFDATSAGLVLLVAAGAGLIALGRNYLAHTISPGSQGSLRAFGSVWRDLARWSVLGVCLTEVTVNAHAYFVTFVFGPASFAVLAVGSLMLRPVVLVLSALPDLERPEMARRIAVGDGRGALRTVKEFRTAAGAVWFATIMLAGAVMAWFPHLVLKHGYDESQVLIVLGLWAAITAVRLARTPESVLLQAAGQFQSLAGAGAWAAAASLVVTIALALTFGPIASLGGILFGDLVMTGRIFALSRRWKLRHV